MTFRPSSSASRAGRSSAFFSLLALFLASCSGVEPFPNQPIHTDLFDKFTTRQIVPAVDLPSIPTRIRFFPGSAEFLVLDQRGSVVHYRLVEDGARRLGSFTVPDVAPAAPEIGLTGVAFDPGFDTNGFVYFAFTTGDNKWNRVVRARWSADHGAVEKSIVTVIEVDRAFPDRFEHGLYSITFGSDGLLYAAMGDAMQPEFAQDPQSLLGKLIRIRPNHGPDGGYRVPDDNPYLAEDGVRKEIAAFGLRTPLRLLAWQDKIYIANVGQNRYEEIELYTLGRVNFGWPFCEGYCEAGGYRNPVLTVSHADPIYQTEDPEYEAVQGLSISLGVAYEGTGADPYGDLLDGRLIFNDVFQGYVRAASIRPDGSLVDDQHIFHLQFITSMDIGPDGYIYGSTLFSPQIFRIERKDDPAR